MGWDSRVLDLAAAVPLEVDVGDAAGAGEVREHLRRAPLRLAGRPEVAEHVAGLSGLAVRVLVVVRREAREPELARVAADDAVRLARRRVGVAVEDRDLVRGEDAWREALQRIAGLGV